MLLAFMWGCKKDNYPGGSISSFIAIYDVRNIYKGDDVTLTKDNMFGSTSITGIVVSDHSGGNMPAGLLIVQDNRRLSQLRGMAFPIGAAAADYKTGDSVIINIEGAVLTKAGGMMQITQLAEGAITKVSSNNTIPPNRVPVSFILANPEKYESTLSVIVKGSFNPLPDPSEVLAGDKMLNDGFGDIPLHTETKATFANDTVSFSANYYGIVFNTIGKDDKPVPHLRLRTGNDVVVLSSTIEVTPIIITGFISDVKGGDGNYEYIQLMATQDIDFSLTPYSLVTTNNAGASTPTGYPAKGWATGEMRTYKFNLSSDTVKKGSFFYVGGAGKMINGSGSTSMATSKWIRAFNYVTTDGDGFGTKTGGLLANSGNAFGMAVFKDTVVTTSSKPIDVIFISTGGSLYTAGPPTLGYRIGNTDFYDIRNPITLADQPYYRSGTNTLSFGYITPTDLGYFNMLGGEYNSVLGKWTKARTQKNVLLSKTSALSEIEGTGATTLK